MTISRAKKQYAKGQRKRATAGEKRLRYILLVLGYGWQHYDPVGYLPDFVSGIWCIAVEVDGTIHNRSDVKRFDRQKARRRFKQAGYYTVRVSEAAGKDRPGFTAIRILIVGIVWRSLRFIFYR